MHSDGRDLALYTIDRWKMTSETDHLERALRPNSAASTATRTFIGDLLVEGGMLLKETPEQEEGASMNDRLLTLKQILSNPETFSWDFALYMNGSPNWSEDAVCAVLDPDDSEDPGKIPPMFAKEHGLRYILDMASVQDIVSNAGQQIVNPSMQTLVKAFNYYVEFDAFEELD